MNRSLIPWKRKGQMSEQRCDAVNPFEALHRQMNELFEDFFEDFNVSDRPVPWRGGEALATLNPHFDVVETEKAVKITAELPGMEEKEIDISLENNVLTVKGEKKEEREEHKDNYFLSERKYGHFQRSLLVTAAIEEDQIKAKFKRGVLTVTLPKTAEARKAGKKIEIVAE